MKGFKIALAGAALAAFAAGPATAGTKVQANIVPATDSDPTVSEKSKLQVLDSGLFKATLKGLTDGAGAPLGSDGSIKAGGGFTGDEYIVILDGSFPALGDLAFAFNLVFEPSKGKGKAFIKAGGLFNLIPSGLHRGIRINGAKLVGPLGAPNTEDCFQNLVDGGFVGGGATNPCDQGDTIGITGILVP